MFAAQLQSTGLGVHQHQRLGCTPACWPGSTAGCHPGRACTAASTAATTRGSVL